MNRDIQRKKIIVLAARQNTTVERLRSQWVIDNQKNIGFDRAVDYLHAIVVSEEDLAEVDEMLLKEANIKV